MGNALLMGPTLLMELSLRLMGKMSQVRVPITVLTRRVISGACIAKKV